MKNTNEVVQFTVEQYGEAKEAAKGLGINSVGKSKQVLVDMVNEALLTQGNGEAQTQNDGQPSENQNEKVVTEAPKAKWYEVNPLDVQAKDVIQITSKTVEKGGKVKEILHNRYAEVVGPSPRENLIRVILLHEKTGEPQNCIITLPIDRYNKMPEGWVFQPSTETSEGSEQPSDEQQSA